MDLPVVVNAMETCKVHLTTPRHTGAEVEAYLTRYLIILICAEYEKKVKDIVLERSTSLSDRHLLSFVQSATDKMIKSIKFSDLSGLLGQFGEDYKRKFSDKVRNTEACNAYETIIVNRNHIAHGGQILNTTFGELQTLFQRSLGVLDAFAKAIGEEQDAGDSAAS